MITWFGRFVGMIIGFVLLGPVGIVIGFILGLQLDRYFHSSWKKGHWAAQSVFFNTTFKVMGYLAKADGRVSVQEIQAARYTMQRMGLNEQQRLKAIGLFNQGKNGQINLVNELSQLRQVCHRQQALLRMFLEIQFQAALADGYLSRDKQEILQQICIQLGIAPINFGGFNSQQGTSQPSRAVRSNLDDAYSLLNITKAATNAEVKKAYRRLMSQHHPDKLVAKGLPDAMIKLATEKTQRIKAAYDQICAARGM